LSPVAAQRGTIAENRQQALPPAPSGKAASLLRAGQLMSSPRAFEAVGAGFAKVPPHLRSISPTRPSMRDAAAGVDHGRQDAPATPPFALAAASGWPPKETSTVDAGATSAAAIPRRRTGGYPFCAPQAASSPRDANGRAVRSGDGVDTEAATPPPAPTLVVGPQVHSPTTAAASPCILLTRSTERCGAPPSGCSRSLSVPASAPLAPPARGTPFVMVSRSPRSAGLLFCASAGASATCAQGHTLQLVKRPGSRWICDICNMDSEGAPPDTARYRCSADCDYDLCARCCDDQLLHSQGKRRLVEVCCPKSHALQQPVPSAGNVVGGVRLGARWICDMCEREFQYEVNVANFRCAECDYDLCKSCYAMSSFQLNQQGRLASPTSGRPRSPAEALATTGSLGISWNFGERNTMTTPAAVEGAMGQPYAINGAKMGHSAAPLAF